MIVISGALVLVALVLLVIGLIDPNLGFVYASIAVSLASFAFLIVGILQRRKELPDSEPIAAAPAPADEATATVVAAAPVAPVTSAAPASADVSGQVLVVAGRPRYHVDGCRYLTGKDAQSVDVADARADGFTACGVCKPDAALAATPPSEDVPPVAAAEAGLDAGDAVTLVDPVGAGDVVESVEVVPAPRVRAARKAPAVAKAPVVEEAPVEVAAPAVVKAPAKAAKTAAKAPAKAAKAPAAKAPASAPAAAKAPAAKRPPVIVIPDRGKFHTPACRYVRGAEGTQELTRAAATKQGYQACGVCNP